MRSRHFLPLDPLCDHFPLHEGLIAEEVTGVPQRLAPERRDLALEDARETSLRPDLAQRVPRSVIQSRVGWLRL